MNDEKQYYRGFEDCLDLVLAHIQDYDGTLPKDFVIQIQEIIQEIKDKKIQKLKEDLCLVIEP